MNEIKIRELPYKYTVKPSDQIIVEDEDGTKRAHVTSFMTVMREQSTFNTVEDMKNADYLNEGDIVSTLGYYEPGDLGAGTYMIVYNPAEVANDQTIIKLNTSDTLRANLISSTEITGNQLGLVGDGVTDDHDKMNNILTGDIQVKFPATIYKISGAVNTASNKIIDFNNATILCPNSAALIFGLTPDKSVSNVTIKNATFKGRDGIEIYAYAKNVCIDNCVFESDSSTAPMSKAITLYGADCVSITNCKIGLNSKVNYGIYMASGSNSSGFRGNTTINIDDCIIKTLMADIAQNTTETDRDVIISNCIFSGSQNTDTSNIETYGVMLVGNSDSVMISDCLFTSVDTGVYLAGTISAYIALNNIAARASRCLYSFGAANSVISLYGYHDIVHTPSNERTYLFDRLTSKIKMNCDFRAADRINNTTIVQSKSALTGNLVDTTEPIYKDAIKITSASQLTSDLTNIIPGFVNVAIDLAFSGTVSKLPHPSLKGQVIALYSSKGAILQNGTIKLDNDLITLDPYIPLVLKNINNVWTRIQ